MRTLIHRRPSPAMIVSLIALFVSMGGIGYAASRIGSHEIKKNAVKSRHIKNGDVTKRDLHRAAVVTVKLADRAVTRSKLVDNAVAASKLAATVDGLNSLNVPANDTASTTVSCPAGGQAISGGYSTPQSGQVEVTRMRRNSDASWSFAFRNNSGTPHVVDARVTCLSG
jgi:hypothetical protein